MNTRSLYLSGLALGLTLLSACQDKPEPVAAAPLPIIENQQLALLSQRVRLDVNVDDLLVAADGIRSTLRQQLLPEAQPAYAGYIAWRGRQLEQMAQLQA